MKLGKHLIPAALALTLHIAALGMVITFLSGTPLSPVTASVEVSFFNSPPQQAPAPAAPTKPAKASPSAPLPEKVDKPLSKPAATKPATATPDSLPPATAATAPPPSASASAATGPQPTPASIRTGISIDAVVAAANPPVFPAVSLRNCEFGTVVARIFVSADGRPEKVELKQTSDYRLLDTAALKAVRAWRFNPELVDGKPIGAWYQHPITFAKPTTC